MAVIWALLTCITRYVTDTLIAIFRKKAASALAVQFHADPLPWSNWHFEQSVFEEEETRTTRRKTLVDEGDNKHCWKTSVLSIAPSLLPTFVLTLIKEIEIYMANWASEENENCVSDWFLKVPMKWNFSTLFYSRKLKPMLHWFIIFEFGLRTRPYEFFLELQSWPIRVKMCDIPRAVKICKLVRLTS